MHQTQTIFKLSQLPSLLVACVMRSAFLFTTILIIKTYKKTRFEGFLIDKGYSTYILDCKDMKYKKSNQHVISTMINIDHRYIHNEDVNLLDKINKGKSVMDDDFTLGDRKGEICFGLHEMGKPPTLINPRPKIRIQKTITEDSVKRDIVITEKNDDAMNIVLSTIEYEDIFKAMFDKSICLELDLRDVAQADA